MKHSKTIHQEMSLFRSQTYTRAGIRLEPKSLMPDQFGKKNGPSWRTLVVLGKGLRRSGTVSAETSNEECRKQQAADLRVEPSRL